MKIKSKKSALIMSFTSLMLCFAMLIGSTFAWFTDTATTGVNKIQSGKLDVALEMADGQNADGSTKWVNAEGKTLSFKKAAGAPADEQILWEPNCTYELPALRVVNNGNLALKYKIQITGIDGDAKLNEAITWTINDAALNSMVDVPLAAGASSDALVIKGHMDENAGNAYQSLTIDGIGITVYATQLDAEFDSFDNDYDKDATYPIEIISAIKDAEMTKAEDATDYTYTNSDKTVTVTVPSAAVTTEATPTVTITPKQNAEAATAIAASGKDAVAYDISVSNVSDGNTSPITVKLYVGKGLQNVVVYHKGAKMDSGVSYDSATGFVTITTTSFSPFDIAFDAPVAAVSGTAYYSLQAAVDAVQSGDTIYILRDQTVEGKLIFPAGKTMTVDWNGKTVTAVGDTRGIWAEVNGNVTFKGDGYVGDNTHEKAGYLVFLNGTLTIEDDATYESGLTVVQLSSENAKMYIKGGTFIGDTYNNVYWTINKLDKYRDKAIAAISGGRFLGFDPSNGHTENPDDNFLASGYSVIKDGDWYTVVANS